MARARLLDAEKLLNNRRYDGAIYICGYAVELSLKAKICRTLKWGGYPQTRNEFDNYRSFRTHVLETLLHLSGIESKIKTHHLADWYIVTQWDPEIRYSPTRTKKLDVQNMINSTKNIIQAL